MKKTLFGVLAILLVLTMVFGGTLAVSAADGEKSPYAGTIKDASGIIVDGKMDEAYASSQRLDINIVYGKGDEGVYTRGVAYALWSSEESCIYFYVLINDTSVSEQRSDYGWDTDGVELFIKRGNDLTLDYTPRLEGHSFPTDADSGKLMWKEASRGRQYRIHGYDGTVNALNTDELAPGYQWTNAYIFDEDLGRLDIKDKAYTQNGGSYTAMVGDGYNEFGWYYSAEEGKNGWAQYTFDEFAGSAGYAVEYKINMPDLKANEQILFDISVCDQYTTASGVAGASSAPWYASAVRVNNPNGIGETAPTGHNTLPKYDYLVLGEEKVASTKIIADAELYNYGRADASFPEGTGDEENKPAYSKTPPVVLNREPGNAPIPSVSGGDGNGGGTTTPTGTTPAPNGGNASSGGCGSSIVLSSSVAMLALVGAAGAFAFRKKDEE